MVILRESRPDRMRAHLAYLERSGAGEGLGRPALFTEPGDDPRTGVLAGERRFFKIILSPENGHSLDMEAYAREFMRSLGRSTGQDLLWAGVVHGDTDNPHCHLVVRGLDRSAREVGFDPQFTRSGMRAIAGEIATRELGYRIRDEEQNRLVKEIGRERFTAIDREISARSRLPDRIVRAESGLEKARLDRLCELGYARGLGGIDYRLPDGWEPRLRAAERRRDRAEAAYRELGDQGRGWRFYSGRFLLEGVVVRKGAAGAPIEEPFILVESRSGERYYRGGFDLHDLREGDRVRLLRSRILALWRAPGGAEGGSPGRERARRHGRGALERDGGGIER